jgi:hypothetical protein
MKTARADGAVATLATKRLRYLVNLLCAFTLLQASLELTAWAKDWAIEVQRVEIKADVAPALVKGQGTGHFSKDYAGGVPFNDADILSGNKFNGVSFEKGGDGKGAPWGSDGYKKGVVFRNDAKIMGKNQIIEGIVITLLTKTDTFKGSDGGSDFDLKEGTDGDGYPTLTITAKASKQLQPGDHLWMRIPFTGEGPARNKFKGYLTGKPAPGELQLTGALEALAPSVGTSGASTLASFDLTSGTLTFSPISVTVVEYCDGSFSTQDSGSETIIGSNLTLYPTTLLGLSDSPGAFAFSDTVLGLQQNDVVRVDGTLTDVVVIPDYSVPGFDSVVTGTLVWEGSAVDVQSRYLIEKFYTSQEVAVFFRSNLLTETNNFTQTGEASGPLQLSTTSTGANCVPAF